ncbi:hypothetical protein [Streptomyces sp. NPDC059398]|uniref:hypothetical protein n=1 Tax=Streptomyces sp. NPDC059398 TaxID=3346820 RepID=UPI0036B05137
MPEPVPEPRSGATSKPKPTPTSTPRPAAKLVFDDPLDQQSPDDTDHGWGERPSGSSASDLARFLDEKPPHHI